LTRFEDIPTGHKFSTMAGQFVKITDKRAIGFHLGDFMDCEDLFFGEVIPCGRASYLELVSLAHCTEVQALLDGEEEEMVEENDSDAGFNEDEVFSIGGLARGTDTGCTEVGEVVGVMTAMGYCVSKGIFSEQEALELFPWWTSRYPNWTEGLVVTLMFDEPVYPITVEKLVEAGYKEEDYKVVRKTHIVTFPEQDIEVVKE
jgi:hypothetical protein